MMKREPIFMKNPIFEEISKRIRESYPNSCILFIDEVINEELLENYELQKQEILEKRGNVDEKMVFHGTKAELIETIAREGFDPSKNRNSAFGKGTYFAKNASYSSSYMTTTDSHEVSYMFLSKVIVGKIGLGKGTVSDLVSDFDILVNNLKNPTIFVTPYRYGAFPQYIVAFHKNAS